MDEYEAMAANLEEAQDKRYKKCAKKIDFWQQDETNIYEAINALRKISKTYDPSNPR